MGKIPVLKYLDEGSSSPFMARLIIGVLKLRDECYLNKFSESEGENKRLAFDKAHVPLFKSCMSSRDAAVNGLKTINDHLHKIDSGEIVKISDKQFDIQESINEPLREEVEKFINQSVITIKSRLQSMLKNIFNIDIGFVFQNEKNFQNGINNLIILGNVVLAKYLEQTRNIWLSKLIDLRNRQEHDGWTIEFLKYKIDHNNKVEVILPKIDDEETVEFLLKTINRVILFVENMLVYALSIHVKDPLFVKEIPPKERDSKSPQRFTLGAKGIDKTPPWELAYNERLDFV